METTTVIMFLLGVIGTLITGIVGFLIKRIFGNQDKMWDAITYIRSDLARLDKEKASDKTVYDIIDRRGN